MFIKFGNFKQKRYKGILEKAAYKLHTDIFNKRMKKIINKVVNNN